MNEQNDLSTARELGEIQAKLDAVLSNQIDSRERAHKQANEMQAMRYDLNQQVKRLDEMQPQVAMVVKRIQFWDTVILTVKWLAGAAVAVFMAGWALGKEIVSLVTSLKG